MLFENLILGWLRDDIFMIFGVFWVSVGSVFGYFLDTVLASIFRGSPGLSQGQSTPGGGGDWAVLGVLKTSLQKQKS